MLIDLCGYDYILLAYTCQDFYGYFNFAQYNSPLVRFTNMIYNKLMLRRNAITKTKDTKDNTIRPALLKMLLEELEHQQATDGRPARIFSELGLAHGEVRADVVTVNGILHGYEIKSDLDNLERLPSQVSAYSRVFEKATLVVGGTHIVHSVDLLPEWWGIILAKEDEHNKITLSRIRPDGMNPHQDSVGLAELLWRNEILSILKSTGEDRGLRSSRRSLLCQKLANTIDQDSLLDIVKSILIDNRPNWRADQLLLQCGG